MQDLKISKIINTDRGSYVALQNQYEEYKLIFIDSFESTMLTFQITGYGDLAHIRTVYQIFSSFMESAGYIVKEVEIEKYNEGVGNAKVSLLKNKTPIYFNCSISDGMIISHINNVNLRCSDNIWNELEEPDEEVNSEFNQEF